MIMGTANHISIENFVAKLFDSKLASLGLSLILFGAFFLLTSEVREASAGKPESIAVIDHASLELFAHLRSRLMDGIAVDVTALGSAALLTILVSGFSLLLIFHGKAHKALHLVAVSIGTIPISHFAKSFFERARPPEFLRLVKVDGYSYPSGHSLSGAAVYLTVAILLSAQCESKIQKTAIFIFFFTLIACIAVSRAYLGVHYLSDTIAGVLLGLAWASTFNVISAMLNQRSTENDFR